MANLQSSTTLDMSDLDFSRFLKHQTSTEFFDEINSTEPVARDVFLVHWTLGGTQMVSGFGGPAFTETPDNFVSGTVRVYIEGIGGDGPDMFDDFWGIRGIRLSAQDILAAAQTPSRKDDADLLRAALSGDDKIHLRGGDDVGKGFDGDDALYGGEGDDRLRGMDGADKLFGGKGADRLSGGNQADTLKGHAGNDKLWGDGGRDTLIGGEGRDVLIGGSHADKFVFNANSGRDVIRDFTDDLDTLVLSTDLWQGRMSRKAVVDTFATEIKGGTLLDFGAVEIRLLGVTDADSLVNDIAFA